MQNLIVRGFVMKTNAIRVNSDGSFGLYFTKESNLKIKSLPSIGVDAGRNKVITCSNGVTESTHKTSIPVKDILARIHRQKQQSNQSRKTRAYLINQINYSVKHDIDWQGVGQVVIEDLVDMKRGLKWGKQNQFWRVAHIHKRIELLCEENDVRLTWVAAAYTSQTCSVCGFKHKNNRSGEKFQCLSCGSEMDADINAAINIRNRGVYSPSTCQNA
jgi:transposase